MNDGSFHIISLLISSYFYNRRNYNAGSSPKKDQLFIWLQNAAGNEKYQ